MGTQLDAATCQPFMETLMENRWKVSDQEVLSFKYQPDGVDGVAINEFETE
jgi:hypothetical protein